MIKILCWIKRYLCYLFANILNFHWWIEFCLSFNKPMQSYWLHGLEAYLFMEMLMDKPFMSDFFAKCSLLPNIHIQSKPLWPIQTYPIIPNGLLFIRENVDGQAMNSYQYLRQILPNADQQISTTSTPNLGFCKWTFVCLSIGSISGQAMNSCQYL